MDISRKSCHYRLYRYVRNVERNPRFLKPREEGRDDYATPASLCGYTWSIIFGLAGIFVLLVAFAFAAPFYLLYLAATAVIGAAIRLGDAIDDRVLSPRRAARAFKPGSRGLHRSEREPRPDRSSLVLAFLKARKQKVCPTIKLVD